MRLRLAALPLLVLLVLAASPGAASAASQWCSESGDTCTSTYKKRGVRYVEKRYAARYLERDRLCVRSPGGRRDCAEGTLRRRAGGIYAVRLRWSRHFPHRGPGTYTVITGAPKRDAVTFRIG